MVWKACSAALLTIIALAPAAARPANDVTTTYFADAKKTKWVGEFELTCGGGHVSFGHKSAFFTKTSDSCSRGAMTPIAMSRFKGTLQDRVAACHAGCTFRFHHRPPAICLPEGCPVDEAAQQCHASCDELGQTNR